MRFGIFLSLFLWVIHLSGTATAACPAAPVGASADAVIQMRAHGGNAGMGPTTAMTATEEGAVVYDATKKTLVVCDGTNWIEMGGGGGGGISATYTDGTAVNGTGTNQTFSNLSIGNAASDRFIVAVLPGSWVTSGAAYNVTAVTIGGVTAQLLTQTALGHRGVSIWWANVPTGTTANVVATYATAVDYRGVALYRISGIVEGKYSYVQGVTTLNSTVELPKNSVAIFGSACGNASPNANWTGLTKNTEFRDTVPTLHTLSTAITTSDQFKFSTISHSWSSACSYSAIAGVFIR